MIERNIFTTMELLEFGEILAEMKKRISTEQHNSLKEEILLLNQGNWKSLQGRISFDICDNAGYSSIDQGLKYDIHRRAVEKLARLYGNNGGVAFIRCLFEQSKKRLEDREL